MILKSFVSFIIIVYFYCQNNANVIKYKITRSARGYGFKSHNLRTFFPISVLLTMARRDTKTVLNKTAVLMGSRFHRLVKKVEWYLFNIRKSD